jgi:hypothetical protein
MLPTTFGAQKKTNVTSDAFSKTRRIEQEVFGHGQYFFFFNSFAQAY